MKQDGLSSGNRECLANIKGWGKVNLTPPFFRIGIMLFAYRPPPRLLREEPRLGLL